MDYNKLSQTIPQDAKVLDLVLTGEWWEAWNKDKKEDYRELTPYWLNRLTGVKLKDEVNKSKYYEHISNKAFHFQLLLNMNLKKFTHVRLSRGYQKNRPTGYVEFGGIEVREGNPEWGAKAGRLYFCIMEKGYKHGNKKM